MRERKYLNEFQDLKCDSCQHGDKDVFCHPCDWCIDYSVMYNCHNRYFEKKERETLYDKSVQWDTRFGKVFAYCKGYILAIKEKFADYSEFRYKHR